MFLLWVDFFHHKMMMAAHLLVVAKVNFLHQLLLRQQ
jgi:hypothetical protein